VFSNLSVTLETFLQACNTLSVALETFPQAYNMLSMLWKSSRTEISPPNNVGSQ
jgi:hypothetical protein